jgi:putative transposase
MLCFKQMKTLQRFAFVHANIHTYFSLETSSNQSGTYKGRRSTAVAEWQVLVS